MNPEQQKSILTIALYAAFADGAKHDREREEIRRIAESLATDAGVPDLARLYQDVLLKRVSLEAAVAALADPGERQLAYEMAACVCDADGRQSEAEQRFLNELKALLKLDAGQAAAFDREADAIVDLGEAAAPAMAAGAATAAVAAVSGAVVAAQPNVTEAELDKSILNYALMNGALELLPQSWASMAIIPLQIKMVYGIGRAHGVQLDQGHIKEFIAAAGVGLTSQYLEQFGRKLLGGLLGKAAGKTFGKVGSAATGMAFSFATTYALGQLAKRYYAGGRVMNTVVLKDTFQNLLGPARQMQTQYLPQIQQQAGTLDMGRVMAMVRGA
ncbi:YcjF family protein [Oceanibaculum nanhaiense]|uniref:YcjF family protein n=1 Tax=Oceanibaculum nanhaiense TaxID=1909734 RepID=UPI00396EB73F